MFILRKQSQKYVLKPFKFEYYDFFVIKCAWGIVVLYIKSYAGKKSIFYTSGFINLVFLWKVWLKKKPDNVLESVFKIG